jgi:serine/threonine protein kinase
MAEVWEARHVQIGKRAAIKFLFPEFARNKELQERFLNEGKRQAQLDHPNIVPALDFLQVDGRSYLVMQYVEGTNLETRLHKENAPLSLKEIHDISWDVLSALDFAHLRGVVHRDVKPANMLIDKSGRTLLTDFGIAKALREERTVTLTGTAMGTPDYMSPEQIMRPKDVDARSDIYSFGCVLYAMLSGNPPFGSEGATAFFIQDRHVRATPPPLVYRNPEIPAAIGDVVSKCLEKEQANRYQSCGEVMTALEAALSGKSTPPRPEPKPQSGVGKYVAAGVVAIALIAGLVYFLRPHSDGDLVRLQNKNWTTADINDADFADPKCSQVQACNDKAGQASNLKKIKDWKSAAEVPYSSSLFNDCMNYQPCIERKNHAGTLVATKDWAHAGKDLLSDCMGYAACLHPPRPVGGGSEEPWPTCCDEASNPKACRAAKAKESIPDCASPYGNNLR